MAAAAQGEASTGTATTATFRRVYETLKAELLRDGSFDFNDDALRWLDAMLDYNVLGGKLNRGLAVVESYKLLKAGSELSEEEEFLACILGWGIEWVLPSMLLWFSDFEYYYGTIVPRAILMVVLRGNVQLQAYFLILDDIMDKSQTRRGKPCWYRLPKVGLIAINDGLVLRSQISRIFKRYFYGKPYYVDLLDLFSEVEFKTTSGELLDQITTSEGQKDLSKYNVDIYRRIVEYKTSYYSFYLPAGCALLLSGRNLDDYVQVKHILVEMGVYFQIQDDYLDCFGDPEVTGKIGTDIEDFKCSWLFVQALVCADERQKDILFENYGKSDPACVTKVKALYKELNLERVFSEFERETYEKLISDIEAQPNEAVQAVLKSFLHKMHRRRK